MAIILLVLGLIFGSFLNAMVYRIHKKMDWVKSRSQCDHCQHTLAAVDLVPLFSWLFLRGRCRYCRKKLSLTHPVVELSTGLVFATSYVFWPANLSDSGQNILFVSWLLTAVGLIALLIYDLRWMLLPSKILYPTAAIAAVGRAIYIVGFSSNKLDDLIAWGLGVLIASGIFWLLFTVSNGRWIGYGDVRLGLVTGTVLASPSLSFLMIFAASLLGCIVALPAVALGRTKLQSKIPYGPFLISATFLTLLWGNDLINWYKDTFLP
jgi:prepilin signal peptidase PulO-like enzyme (type II secretory pathway)